MRQIIIFSVLVLCCLAATKKHAQQDKAAQIMNDISKGVDITKQIESLFGNQEFALEADNQLAQHKKHHNSTKKGTQDKASQIMNDISKGVDIAKALKGLFGGSHSSGNQEFDLEADNQLAQHKKHHNSTKKGTQDKASQIMGDISKGVDLAKELEGLFGKSHNSGNQEFDLEADNQLAQHKKHHNSTKKGTQDKASQIMNDISKGVDIAKALKGLFGGSHSNGNQEFDFEADDQLDKATQIMNDISEGVDVAKKIEGLFKKHSKASQKTQSGSSNQEFDLF